MKIDVRIAPGGAKMNSCLKEKLKQRILKALAVPLLLSLFLVSATVFSLFFPSPCAADGESYSFVVFGDSRIPAYVPYDKEDKEKLDKLVGLVAGYAMEGQEPEYEAVFDSQSRLLERIVVPGATAEQSRTIVYGRDGWPDVFVDKDGEKVNVTLLSSGQEWVYDNVVRELEKGAAEGQPGPEFCLHTGDIVYFGFQGKTAGESPYWQDFDRRFFPACQKALPKDFPPGSTRSWVIMKPGETAI